MPVGHADMYLLAMRFPRRLTGFWGLRDGGGGWDVGDEEGGMKGMRKGGGRDEVAHRSPRCRVL